MIISHTSYFRKKFKKRIEQNTKLAKQFRVRLEIFKSGENLEILKIHDLRGKLSGYYAFSITGDIRVIFQKISEDEIILVDIGSHNQVY